MESKNDKTVKLAKLPDGQLVRIEEMHSDGYVSVRRIDGEWAGMIAVCAVEKLEPIVATLDR